MEGVLISSVVSLANLAWHTCMAAKEHKEECVRIGERLMSLIVLTKAWTDLLQDNNNRNDNRGSNHRNNNGLPSYSSLVTLQRMLRHINLALQANAIDSSRWPRRVQRFMKSTNLLEEIRTSEGYLNSALQDFAISQNTHLSSQNQKLHERFERVEQILLYLAAQKDPSSSSSETFLQEINCVLQHHQIEGLHVSSSTHSGQTDSTATLTSNSSNNSVISSFGPSDREMRKLEIDTTRHKVRFGELIGEGSFGEVYRGRFKGYKVAIKQVKSTRLATASHNETAYLSMVRGVQNEAALTSRCGIHTNIVHMFGCYTKCSDGMRPFVVMELMNETLFSAIHGGMIGDTGRRVDLLQGIASALEFLHLQGIIHRDIKSMVSLSVL